MGRPPGESPARQLPAVAQRFGDVDPANLGRGGQVNKMFLRNMATGTVTPQPTPNLLPINASDLTFMAGKAYASSEGDGTTFRVTIPIRAVQTAASEERQAALGR